MITATFVQRDPALPKPCERSFAQAMIVRRMLEFRVSPLGGFNWFWADKLRTVCLGIVRNQVAQRMVENKQLAPVEAKAIEGTRNLFASLKGLVTDDLEKISFSRMIDHISCFRPQVQSGQVDLLTWCELTRGSKEQFQRLASRQHIVSVMAFFLGRCPQPEDGVSDHPFDQISDFMETLVHRRDTNPRYGGGAVAHTTQGAKKRVVGKYC
jgi:hypothetical protein